jgi:hypothetical protein
MVVICPVEDKEARGGGTQAAMEFGTAGYGGGAAAQLEAGDSRRSSW